MQGRLRRMITVAILGGGAARSTLLNGLVAYWKHDEANGNHADSTGRGNTLTNNGASVATPGVIGNAAALDGTQDFSIASNPDVAMGDNDYTLAGWFSVTDADNLQVLVSKGWDAGGEYGLMIQGRALYYMVYAAGGEMGRAQTAHPEGVQAGLHFVAIRHDAANNKMYLNCDAYPMANANTTGPAGAGANALYFGSLAGGFRTTGFLDEWGAWKRLLTDDEVTELYNGGAGKTYPFDRTPGKAIFDGDSLTWGAGPDVYWQSYPCKAMQAAIRPYLPENYPILGQTAADLAADVAAQIVPRYDATRRNNLVFGWAGINDLRMTLDTPAQIYQYLVDYFTPCKTAGFVTVAFTITPSLDIGMTNPQETFEANRQALNTLIRNTPPADHLIDIAADARFSDPNDGTYFAVDKLHLTAASYAIIGQWAANILNGY